MLNIPGRIHSVTGMLSVFDLLRNPRASWAFRTGPKPAKSVGTISLNLLRNRNGLRQGEVRLRIARQYFGDRWLRRKLGCRRHRRSLDLHFLIAVHTCTGRDEVTDDDVLLESEQLVSRAADCRVGEDSRRLLEARCGDER